MYWCACELVFTESEIKRQQFCGVGGMDDFLLLFDWMDDLQNAGRNATS